MLPGRGRLGGSYAPARAGARHADRVTPALQPDSVPAALVRPGGGDPATVLREGEPEAPRGFEQGVPTRQTGVAGRTTTSP
jgi:hypothetical protein